MLNLHRGQVSERPADFDNNEHAQGLDIYWRDNSICPTEVRLLPQRAHSSSPCAGGVYQHGPKQDRRPLSPVSLADGDHLLLFLLSLTVFFSSPLPSSSPLPY
eukprot:92981-Hanusia_phi.AAC.1